MSTGSFAYKYDHMEFTKFVPQLKKELIKAIGVFGRRASGKGALGLQRHLERASGYAPNNPWWKEAKGKKRVFYDTGFWRSKPTYKILPGVGDILIAIEIGFVGPIAHPSPRQSGNFNVQRIATFLTQGATWTPTPRQRKAFWARVRRRGVKDFSGVIPKKTYESKPRDFVTKHLMSPKVKQLFMQYIDKAVARAYKTTPRKKASG